MANQTNKNLLNLYKNFLNYFWLRPENAILSCFRALDFRKVVSENIKKKQKILDISCGDGVFTFIALGGKLDTYFDAFKSIKNKKRTSKFDAYNYYDKNFKVKIIKKPKYIVETGTDWKNNLLRKSEKLNLYKNLILHNNEKKLDIVENSYDLVFSNSAYWVKNIKQHLLDIKRVTKVNGHIYLQMKFKDTFLSTLIKNQSKVNFGKKFEKDDVNFHLYSWSPSNLGNLFTEAGFEVEITRPYLHKWPPKFFELQKIFGWTIFNLICRVYAKIERSWGQVEIVAIKK